MMPDAKTSEAATVPRGLHREQDRPGSRKLLTVGRAECLDHLSTRSLEQEGSTGSPRSFERSAQSKGQEKRLPSRLMTARTSLAVSWSTEYICEPSCRVSSAPFQTVMMSASISSLRSG